MEIKLGKTYKTRSGMAVRLYTTDGGDSYPVHGAVQSGENIWWPKAWTASGAYRVYAETHLDLVEVNPYDHFKIDDPVMVRDEDGKSWSFRRFAEVNILGKPMCFIKGTDSKTASSIAQWEQCRALTREEEVKYLG